MNTVLRLEALALVSGRHTMGPGSQTNELGRFRDRIINSDLVTPSQHTWNYLGKSAFLPET